MNHLDEEQLVLYYYGETAKAEGVEEHLGACESCRQSYRTLQRVLNTVDGFPVPERPADYEAQVWASIERRLSRRRVSWFRSYWKPLLVAVSTAVLVLAAFVSGREWQRTKSGSAMADSTSVRKQVLLVALSDHLERSQMILVELSNAGAPKQGQLDISDEQNTAEDLVEENRLYRQTAASMGDAGTASVLDDLERALLEIAHSPSSLSEKQLDDLRKQLEDQGILMKVKVFGSEVRQRETAPPSSGS